MLVVIRIIMTENCGEGEFGPPPPPPPQECKKDAACVFLFSQGQGAGIFSSLSREDIPEKNLFFFFFFNQSLEIWGIFQKLPRN